MNNSDLLLIIHNCIYAICGVIATFLIKEPKIVIKEPLSNTIFNTLCYYIIIGLGGYFSLAILLYKRKQEKDLVKRDKEIYDNKTNKNKPEVGSFFVWTEMVGINIGIVSAIENNIIHMLLWPSKFGDEKIKTKVDMNDLSILSDIDFYNTQEEKNKKIQEIIQHIETVSIPAQELKLVNLKKEYEEFKSLIK